MIVSATEVTRGEERDPHLHLGHGKVLPQTHSRSIYKSQQVFIPLYLRQSVSSSFIQIQTQPPFRVKLARVTSPQFLGHVDANDGDADDSAFSDENAVDEIAGCGADRVGEWEGVVDIGLAKMKGQDQDSKGHNYTPPSSLQGHWDVSSVPRT